MKIITTNRFDTLPKDIKDLIWEYAADKSKKNNVFEDVSTNALYMDILRMRKKKKICQVIES